MSVSINTAIFLDQLQAGTSQLDCAKTLVGKPIDNLEVRGEFFKSETKADELAQLDALCQANHWGFYYSIPEALFDQGQLNTKIADDLEMASRYHIQGLKISLGDPKGVCANDLHEFAIWLEAAKTKLTVENQPNANSQLPLFTKQVKQLCAYEPRLGYTFDSGNWYWIDTDPAVAFNALASLITVFHLKDIADRDTVMLDHGATDWRAMLNQLADSIPIFLEYAIAPADVDAQIALVNAVISQRQNGRK